MLAQRSAPHFVHWRAQAAAPLPPRQEHSLVTFHVVSWKLPGAHARRNCSAASARHNRLKQRAFSIAQTESAFPSTEKSTPKRTESHSAPLHIEMSCTREPLRVALPSALRAGSRCG